ncbi:MAG TPA: hypothetical protein VNH83_01355 [Bryobacteraceae bacterium]|nr:hypothetical protein [Bryobacteraceae bacterium]
MNQANPYLSVVVTARNDDHGGNLLGRMQAFVNAFINQMTRHHIDSELIIVEWNPPEDRPSLKDVLKWPPTLGSCCVRFIKVPAGIHGRFRHSDVLPLYQMIAKNVGIRRARGCFVLATNIDILFSDELVEYLAAGKLESRRMYRIDRHDVMSGVPADGTPNEQLAYCRTHLVRVNTREGTFRITPEGRRALESVDIAEPDSGVSFGAGWFAVESAGAEGVCRCVENNAEVYALPSSDPAPPLIFDMEPAFGAGDSPFVLQVVTPDGAKPCSAVIKCRSIVTVQLPAGCRLFRFCVLGGGCTSAHDPRIVNFRVFRCRWGSPEKATGDALRRTVSCEIQAQPASIHTRALGFLAKLRDLRARIANSDRVVQVSIPVGSLMGRLVRMAARVPQSSPSKPDREASFPEPPPGSSTVSPLFLHTNACGDFTLMARDHWFDLRGYPEFEVFSMNIDSVLCYAAHHAGFREEILRDPMRIYHIEHQAGSGWTPEGQAKLFARIAAKGIPWLDYREFVVWAEQMRRFNSTMIFNRQDWGLANDQLTEIVLPAAVSTAI